MIKNKFRVYRLLTLFLLLSLGIFYFTNFPNWMGSFYNFFSSRPITKVFSIKDENKNQETSYSFEIEEFGTHSINIEILKPIEDLKSYPSGTRLSGFFEFQYQIKNKEKVLISNKITKIVRGGVIIKNGIDYYTFFTLDSFQIPFSYHKNLTLTYTFKNKKLPLDNTYFINIKRGGMM